MEKEENGRKVAYIIFYVKKKGANEVEVIDDIKPDNKADFIVELARELSSLSLTYDELNQIAVISDYDKNMVSAAFILYNKLQSTDNFVDWFAELRK